MDILEHKKIFLEIVKKYDLSNGQKADEVSKFLASSKNLSYEDFSNKFNLELKDSKIFIDFILKGISFKEQNLDKTN